MPIYDPTRTYKPTRHRDGQESSVLDLVFTLDPNMVTDLEHLPPLGHSDHHRGMKFYYGLTSAIVILKYQYTAIKLIITSRETMML